MKTVVGLFVAYLAALVPGLASVYNPHQYDGDPLFQPAAVNPVLAVAAAAVIAVWLLGRRWSQRTQHVVLVAGLVLTVATVGLLWAASARPLREAGPLLTAASLAGTLAIPCMAVLSVVFKPGREASRA